MAATGPTASGRSRAIRGSLILTVTRACNLRCSYCPTAKEGWPSLSADQAVAAVRLFSERYGGGIIKLFGGEPLLVPEVVRAVFDASRDDSRIERVQLSTNGLGLDSEWLEYLRGFEKGVLTISLDGRPDDHRRFRRGLPGIPDSYSAVMALREELLATPRVVITQTIAPAAAEQAGANFEHLLSLGFWRFNLLPGYFLPWKADQLRSLRADFESIGGQIRARWAAGDRLYLRNLFTWAPTPFFNRGLVVDSDGTIHPSNVGLSGALDGLRGRTQVGTLDEPPSVEALQAAEEQTNALLQEVLTPRVWRSTLAADAELSRLVRGLYLDYAAMRRARGAA